MFATVGDPGLDPDALFDGWPSDLWGALVLQVIGQKLSRAAAGPILGRLEALHGNRLPTPAELLDTDAETLPRIGLSRAKGGVPARPRRAARGRSARPRAVADPQQRRGPRRAHPSQGCRPVHRRRGADAGAAPPGRLARRRPSAAPGVDGSGRSTPRRRSTRWTPSASASGPGGRWLPPTLPNPESLTLTLSAVYALSMQAFVRVLDQQVADRKSAPLGLSSKAARPALSG